MGVPCTCRRARVHARRSACGWVGNPCWLRFWHLRLSVNCCCCTAPQHAAALLMHAHAPRMLPPLLTHAGSSPCPASCQATSWSGRGPTRRRSCCACWERSGRSRSLCCWTMGCASCCWLFLAGGCLAVSQAADAGIWSAPPPSACSVLQAAPDAAAAAQQLSLLHTTLTLQVYISLPDELRRLYCQVGRAGRMLLCCPAARAHRRLRLRLLAAGRALPPLPCHPGAAAAVGRNRAG